MTDTSSEASALDKLLATVVDSIKGFETACEHVKHPRIKAAFSEVASERRTVVSQIEQGIRALGEEPHERGTVLGTAHRALMEIRDAVSTADTAVVDEAERGEDYIKAAFEQALEDQTLTGTARDTIKKVTPVIIAGHDRISALKHDLHG